MMTKLADDVRAFHEKFGHPVREKPTIPTDAEMRFRLKLITEEYLELLAASIREPVAGVEYSVFAHARHLLTGMIDYGDIEVDLPELVDAMADLDYVVEGTRVACGIDGAPIHDEVQRANMEKKVTSIEAKCKTTPQCIACDRLGFHLEPDPTAKPTKPNEWKAPMIEVLLLEQGWKK